MCFIDWTEEYSLRMKGGNKYSMWALTSRSRYQSTCKVVKDPVKVSTMGLTVYTCLYLGNEICEKQWSEYVIIGF